MRLFHRQRASARGVLVAACACAALAFWGRPAQAQGGADYTAADVQFMQGMIYHHAQAVAMADWAKTHGASPLVTLFCKKVALSQFGEIKLMQNWLAERKQEVPDPLGMLKHDTTKAMNMPGMAMGGTQMSSHMMPGMLTPDQMKQLDAAHDTTFDRLFLIFMIQHHRGALSMVADLFASPRGGQQADIFAFASGVNADQSAEITRMQQMLTAYTKE